MPAATTIGRLLPSLEQFIQYLIQSGLTITAEVFWFQASLSPDKRPNDEETFARELVKAIHVSISRPMDGCNRWWWRCRSSAIAAQAEAKTVITVLRPSAFQEYRYFPRENAMVCALLL
jgi:hypothetical protein